MSRKEPSAHKPSDNVGSEVTLYAPTEEAKLWTRQLVQSPMRNQQNRNGFVMVSSRNVAEASTDLESTDNEIVSPQFPVEGSNDNVNNEALEPEAVHEVVKILVSFLTLSLCSNNWCVSQMSQLLGQLGFEETVDLDEDLLDDLALPEVISLVSFWSKVFS